MELNDFMAAMQQEATPKEKTQKEKTIKTNAPKTNAKFVCPECGQGVENNLNDCPNCGCPKEELIANDASTNISPALESSNNFNAEHVVNSVAKGILTGSIFVAALGVIGAIIIFATNDMGSTIAGSMLIIIGLLILFLGIINWAVLRLLVNISYRLTRIDNKQK